MRAGEIRALAERAGIAPGVSVLDLCCGVAGPGRFITRELGCTYLGVDASASAIEIARASAPRPPLPLRGRADPAAPARPVRRGAAARDDARLSDKETLLEEISRALTDGGRFAFTLEEGPPLTEAERARMPDADTVWLTPLDEMPAARAGRAGRSLAGGLERVAPRYGGLADRRVRGRRDGHRCADRTPRAGRPACCPPAVERVAGDGARPQDRTRRREAGRVAGLARRPIASPDLSV